MADQFTAHNIRLGDGSETAPQIGWLIADSPWLKAASRTLDVIYPNGTAEKRIVDLGCLEGGYTVEFARRGMLSLGIEARAANFANCEIVRAGVNLPNLSFAHDDVWNIGAYGRFDVVFCCGLLYHLDRPVEFIRLVSTYCEKAIIINSHFSRQDINPNFPVSELAENEGVRGRWFQEFDPQQANDLEQLKWAAWSNYRSFWPMWQYIPQILRDAGFDLVFEQFDWLGDDIAGGLMTGYHATHDRGMFVGIRTGEK